MSDYEKRRHYRVPCHIPAQLQFADGPFVTGEIIDMTVYGACVHVEKLHVRRDSSVHLSFIANGVRVDVGGVVAWLGGQDQFGVRFTDVQATHLLHIASYLYTRMQMLGFRPVRLR